MKVLKYSLQDLKRQKIKTIFGIGGIAIAIFLMTVVGILADSLSYSYLDQATYEAGSSDIVFQKISAQDFNFDPYFNQDIVEERLKGSIEEIDYYFPRLNTYVSISNNDSLTNKIIKKIIFGYGINTTLEQNSNKLGNLWLCDKIDGNYVRTDQLYKGPIKDQNCILTKNAAKLFNVDIGDVILVKHGISEESVRIEAIIDQDLRFTRVESTLIIFELPWFQMFINQVGNVNSIHTTLKNPESIYDNTDIQGTTRILRQIAEKIQINVGFEFGISMPRLEQLESAEQQTMTLTMMFSFISFFSMLITGILINSILSTSVEERIREFGILRVLGAKKDFTFKMIFITGFLMSVIGTLLGIIIGIFIGPPLLRAIFNNIISFSIELVFIIRPFMIIRSIFIGIGITSLVAIIPAFKAGKKNIANAIDPSHNMRNNDYKISKEGNINGRLIGIGLGISAIGIFLFLILPRLLTGSGGPNLTNYILIGLLIVVLIGVVFAAIGFVPLIENVISRIIKPFIKKYYEIYKINLYRYRRRNISTIVMFALTFAFIFYISSQLEMDSANTAMTLKFQYGSDLILSNSGNPEDGDAINMELYGELQNIPGIKSTAIINHNSIDISRLFGVFMQIQEEGFNPDDGNVFNQIFGDIPKYSSYVGDIGGYNNFETNLIGIDENYLETVDNSLLMWDSDTNSSINSINDVLQNSNHCVIAKILADHLGITELPAEIRLTMSDPFGDSFSNVSILTVVGVSRGMPGIFNFRSSELSLYMGPGILLNLDDYNRIMNWGDLSEPSTVIDKILIDLIDDDYENVQEMQLYIENYFNNDYDFMLEESITLIQRMQSQNRSSNTIMQIILFFSIIVSLFGLLASMYSTLLERMYEIGILRAIGLKPHEVRSMFMYESITVMLSSGSLGAITGWFIAYLMQTNIAILTETPVITTVSIPTLLVTFLVSILLSIIGMYFITRKIYKWSIIDVLRSTF